MSGRLINENFETPFNNLVLSTMDTIDPFMVQAGVYPNFLTMLSFIFELNGVQKLNVGRWKEAIFSILLGRIIDVYDGNYARRRNKTTEFGSQLDSATDLISFIMLWYVLISRYGNKRCSAVLTLLVFMFIFSKIHSGCRDVYTEKKSNNILEEQFKSWCSVPKSHLEEFLHKSKWFGTNHVILLVLVLVFMFETNRIS